MVGGLKIVRVKAEHVAKFERLFAELRRDAQTRTGLSSLLIAEIAHSVGSIHCA